MAAGLPRAPGGLEGRHPAAAVTAGWLTQGPVRDLIDTFASAVEVVSFDEAAAIEYGRLGSILAERGTPIGEFDALIAAHAVALRCTLVTNDVRHLSKVPGLSVENWA